MSARDDIAAHFTSDTLADSLLDAFRAEVLREAKGEVVTWLVKKAREYRSTGSKQHALEADVIGLMASKIDRGAVRLFLDKAGKVTPNGGEITRAAHADGQPPLIGAFGGAGMGRAPSGDALIVEPQLWFTDAPAAEEGEVAIPGPAELTVYRASHESIVMGLYTTRQAAYEHCEAHELRDDPVSPMAWNVDEDGVAELVRTRVPRSPGAEAATGYVVTPLTVASEYDEEADE